MRGIAWAFPIAPLLIPVCVFAADITGRVVGVIDGDTIEVLHNHHPEHIRLSTRLWEKVTLQTHGLDKYESAIADVLLPDGTNVIHALVKDGWYCWCRKHAPNLNLQG